MGLILLWISGGVCILLGFFVYFLLTGHTPVEFWKEIGGTAQGTMIKGIFASCVAVGMITFALKIFRLNR